MKPGIYRDIDIAAYHADPCEEPSLSQSIAKVLIDRSPLHAAAAHPRLTKQVDDDEEAEKYVKAKVIGDAAHKIMIGRGKDLAVAKFADWRTKEAKAFRDEATAAGRTPILEAHLGAAHQLVFAGRAQIDMHQERDCFQHGSGEVALIWQEGPIWFRCLVDWLRDDLRGADDYKTSAMSVAPHVIGLRAADAGWHIQAAMIERGLDALDPDNAGRRSFRFIAQEQDEPYALNVMLMTEAWLTMGRKQLQHAVDLWSACIATGRWPGYPPYAIEPEFPGWKESQWLNREIAEAARGRLPADDFNPNILAAG